MKQIMAQMQILIDGIEDQLYLIRESFASTQEAMALVAEAKALLLSAEDSEIPAYDPKFGDGRMCECGHTYYRHFDTHEDMEPVGCKYCSCGAFKEQSVARASSATQCDAEVPQIQVDTCPVCSRELSIGQFVGGAKYPFQEMPFYKQFCEGCDYVSPVGSGDYGEVLQASQGYYGGEAGEYDADDDGAIIIIPAEADPQFAFQIRERVTVGPNGRHGEIHAFMRSASGEVSYIVRFGLYDHLFCSENEIKRCGQTR